MFHQTSNYGLQPTVGAPPLLWTVARRRRLKPGVGGLGGNEYCEPPFAVPIRTRSHRARGCN
jgi:hypothetical protein